MSRRATRGQRKDTDINHEQRRIKHRQEEHVDELIASAEMRDCFDVLCYLMDHPQVCLD